MTEFGYFASEKKKQSCLQVKCQEKWWVAVTRFAVKEFVDCLLMTFGVVGG